MGSAQSAGLTQRAVPLCTTLSVCLAQFWEEPQPQPTLAGPRSHLSGAPQSHPVGVPHSHLTAAEAVGPQAANHTDAFCARAGSQKCSRVLAELGLF